MGRVCVGRLCYGPSLQWAEFAMGRDVQLPFVQVADSYTWSFQACSSFTVSVKRN